MGCVCVGYWSAVTFYYLFSPLEAQIRTDESCLTHSRQVLGWTLEDQMFSLMLMSSKSLRRWLRLRIHFSAQRENPLLMVIQSRWWECLCPLSSLIWIHSISGLITSREIETRFKDKDGWEEKMEQKSSRQWHVMRQRCGTNTIWNANPCKPSFIYALL